MHKIIAILSFSLLFSSAIAQQTLNPIVGDSGFFAAYDRQPDAASTECERIISHLEFVHARLSARNPGQLSQTQKANREDCLALLSEYISEGRFPENREFSGRRPIFIDGNGTYCAVGYLIQQTAGARAAQAIDSRHHADYVLDMDADLLRPWAEANGFSIRELAMIQPTYGSATPVIRYQAWLKDALEAEGVGCPGLAGPFLLECQFDIIGLQVANLDFSNRDYPELNRALSKIIHKAEISPGGYWGDDRVIRNGGPYIIRVLFDENIYPAERYYRMSPMVMFYDFDRESSYPYLPLYQLLEGKKKQREQQGAEGGANGSGKQFGGTLYANILHGKPAKQISFAAISIKGDTLAKGVTDRKGRFEFSLDRIPDGGCLVFNQEDYAFSLPVPLHLCGPEMELYIEIDHVSEVFTRGENWTLFYEGC